MITTGTRAKTRGEEVFEQYLNSHGLRFSYEPDFGTRKRPDYLVHAPSGDVLCEVKDFEQNDEDRAEVETALAGRNTVAFREIPYGRIQLRIRAGSRQLREFKGRYPCLIVLFDSSAQILLSDFTVLGAMYGETRIGVPIRLDDDERDAEASTVFDRETRYLTRTSNTTVSAVAILEHVTPKEGLLDEALVKQDFGDGPDRLTRILEFIYNFGEQHPEIFERVPRLNVLRNLFAAVPWPDAAFNGPHDLVWPNNSGGTKS